MIIITFASFPFLGLVRNKKLLIIKKPVSFLKTFLVTFFLIISQKQGKNKMW